MQYRTISGAGPCGRGDALYLYREAKRCLRLCAVQHLVHHAQPHRPYVCVLLTTGHVKSGREVEARSLVVGRETCVYGAGFQRAGSVPGCGWRGEWRGAGQVHLRLAKLRNDLLRYEPLLRHVAPPFHDQVTEFSRFSWLSFRGHLIQRLNLVYF